MTKGILDILVLQGQLGGQDLMVSTVLQESKDHQVLHTRGYLVPKVSLVILDSKDFQGAQALQALVFQDNRGHMDLREIRETQALQEFLGHQAPQVKNAVVK